MSDVRLVDLDLFKRYSLAIRQESAPVEEVLAILDVTRRQVLAAGGMPDEAWAPSVEPEPETAAGSGGEVEDWVRQEEEAEATAWAGGQDGDGEEAHAPEAAATAPAGGRRVGRRKAAVAPVPTPEERTGTATDEAVWAPEPVEQAVPTAGQEAAAGGDEPGAGAARRRRPRAAGGEGGGAAPVRRRR